DGRLIPFADALRDIGWSGGQVRDLYLSSSVKVANAKIIGARQTGWTAASGVATRTTFATSTVTLSVLAEHVKALIDDLLTHGLIGA
ncbi:MAG TPA: hypothetical protein VI670_27850, partial [Thermoanaerobaculia bacterium]